MADELHRALDWRNRAALQHLEVVLVLVAHEVIHAKVLAALLRDDLTEDLIARAPHVMNEVCLIKWQSEVMERVHLHARMDGFAVDDDAIHVKDKCCRLQSHSP